MATQLFTIHKVYYAPGLDVVTIAVQAVNGPFKGRTEDLYTSQEALQKRAASAETPWGDAEVRAETAELLLPLEAELAPEPETHNEPEAVPTEG